MRHVAFQRCSFQPTASRSFLLFYELMRNLFHLATAELALPASPIDIIESLRPPNKGWLQQVPGEGGGGGRAISFSLGFKLYDSPWTKDGSGGGGGRIGVAVNSKHQSTLSHMGASSVVSACYFVCIRFDHWLFGFLECAQGGWHLRNPFGLRVISSDAVFKV